MVQQAQQSGTEFREAQLFGRAGSDLSKYEGISSGVEKAVLLSWNTALVQNFRTHAGAPVTLTLPFENGNSITLDLVPAKNLTNDFEVRVASDGFSRPQNVDKGVHYWGTVSGDPATLVAISVFENEVMGAITTADAHYVIGAIANTTDKAHILYKDSDLKSRSTFECNTDDVLHQIGAEEEEVASRVVGPDNCVRMYVETDYTLFQNKGSVANVTTYMTGLFSQVSALYTNEAVNLTLHNLYVWDVTDPFTGPTASDYLTQFRNAKNGVYNGDLAHFVGINGLGGVAYVDVLCNGYYGVGYSSVNATYSNVPTYSWSVEVLTHEIGHNLGSSHTHACAWNGNNTAIDGCAPTYNAAYAEGTCATGPLPTGTGGTIMSYCHLLSNVGINFNNGFGTQPGNRIRTEVYNAACLTTCSTTPAPSAPTTLAATAVSSSQINLTWTDVATNETAYKVERATAAAGPWTEIAATLAANTTAYSATGLSASTTYYFRVRASNAGGDSPYSNTANATTSAPSCSYITINSNNFDASLGIWTDGGTDCARVNNATYASSPTYSMELRDNTTTSLMSTTSQNLTTYTELTVTFSYVSVSFENGEDFWVQISTNGGSTYTTKATYAAGTHFTNGVRGYGSVVIAGPFTSNTRLRFRADASADDDKLYIDDVVITGCQIQLTGETPDRTDITGNNALVIGNETAITNLRTGPNPATNIYNVTFETATEISAELIVSDLTGRVVAQQKVQTRQGENQLSLETGSWANGMYIVQLRAGTDTITRKMVVAKQ